MDYHVAVCLDMLMQYNSQEKNKIHMLPPRNDMLARVLAVVVCLSVCLSVCLCACANVYVCYKPIVSKQLDG